MGGLKKVKVIGGKEYENFEEYNKGLKCFFETCSLTWDNTKWTTVRKD